MTIPTGTNFNRMLKDDILWLYNHYCKHGHRYTEHPKCFIEEWGDKLGVVENAVCLDIETTNLSADFGYILCYSLKPLNGDIINRTITPQEIKASTFDRDVVKQFLKDVKGVDKLITYYGSNFDIPFLRTRALRWGLGFPEWKDILSVDVYYIARAKLRTHRKRLETIADLMDIPSKQHRLNPEVWMKAQAGDQGALDWVRTHCNEDVITLEEVYRRLINFRGTSKTSI